MIPVLKRFAFNRMMKNRNKSSDPHRTAKAMSRSHDFNATCLDGGGVSNFLILFYFPLFFNAKTTVYC